MHEIMAISGHTTLKEVARYTEAVDREHNARAAMAKRAAAREQTMVTESGRGVKPVERIGKKLTMWTPNRSTSRILTLLSRSSGRGNTTSKEGPSSMSMVMVAGHN